MFGYLLSFVAAGCIFLTGCKQAKKDMMPELATCDSAAVMYYKMPNNPRFFTLAKVYDHKIVSSIANDINGRVIPAKDTCATQGKIYYYGKGDAVYIAYFSSNRDCMILSFIKTGEKYFVAMSESTKKLLAQIQKTAVELKSEIE